MRRGTDGIVRLIFMDPILDLERRRLLVSAALTARARRRLGSRLPAGIAAGELLDLARGLSKGAGSIEHAYHLRFEPAYPGVTATPESIGRTSKLLLACSVRDPDGTPIGVVFTALIAGRPPQVSVAPSGAGIPGDWRPPGDLHQSHPPPDRRGGVRGALRALRGRPVKSPATLRDVKPEARTVVFTPSLRK
jgi:hypothetical protein